MSRVRVNYKSDLPPIGIAFMLGEHEIPVPTTDFVIRFFVEGSPGLCFECLHKGEEYINCEVTDEDTLTCYINNHGFCCGRLCCEFIDLSRNVKYADGVQKTVTPTKLNIVLVEGAGDDLVEITESIAIDIETVIGEIREAMARLDEYADIIAALQAAVLTIPDVIDDLETGGHTDALSAEQGKILKEILDNLGRISVEGITGFTPISSLNELPENPTTEQKRQAYLFENALYVYVGAGGDTLDGKYQSVELVNLDWGDKSYNTSEFSGLGRRWLKKNMVEGVNVLTSAMIGTDNTEYFIQYDYDLDGAEVTLPANTSLVFMGGSIKNGTLVGNNTRIQAKKGVCIFDDITIQGTWDVAEAYSSWFKMHKAGYLIQEITNRSYIMLGEGFVGGVRTGVYYDDITKIGDKYYVTSTLVDGAVVEDSIRVLPYWYPLFKVDVEGDNTEYLGAPPGTEEWGTLFDFSSYTEKDDTASLQSLLDIRAKRTIIEEGTYMIKGNKNYTNSWYNGLFVDGHKSSELVIDGWLKVLPNGTQNFFALDVIGCEDFKICGNGGIQGELVEHRNNVGEGGMNIAIANSKNITIEGITTAYAWGDCIYNHWNNRSRRVGTPLGNDLQGHHTYKSVNFVYGGRTGLVYELGDNVVVDGCYFYGTGLVRGKSTWSAVDVEPFASSDTTINYVKNFEFKNNVFENSVSGLRLERCANCSVHDNHFKGTSTGIHVARHNRFSYKVEGQGLPDNRAWFKSYMKIYNNFLKDCSSQGIMVNDTTGASDIRYRHALNVEIYGNTLIDCGNPIFQVSSIVLEDSSIHDNTTYRCGKWQIGVMRYSDIYNNKNHACNMPAVGATDYGAGRIFELVNGALGSSRNSKVHHNSFYLDYGRPIQGFGTYGEEEIFHGPPVGYTYRVTYNTDLDQPQKIHFYENHISDDFYLFYGEYSNFDLGMNSMRDESSEVFLVGDTFRSHTYGDEGTVTAGGITSCSWIDNLNGGEGPREFESGMEVASGEVIKILSGGNEYYKICMEGGECGDTLEPSTAVSGTAKFTNKVAYNPTAAAADHIKIAYRTRGVCTSSTRPETFLSAGRRMWETDTKKEVIYDGTNWVYVTTTEIE